MQDGSSTLGIGVRELAVAAGVSPETVVRLEGGETLRPRTLAAVHTALEAAGIEFIEQNGGGPGVRLRSPPARQSHGKNSRGSTA